MILLILAVIILVAIMLLIQAGILVWLEKLFKIESPTYKNSLKTLIFSSMAGIIVGEIFIFINLGFLSDVISIIISFFVFHYFLKKYYLSSWKKSSSIYVVFLIIGMVIYSAIVIPTRLYIISPFAVRGEGMSPTYNNSDYILVDKFDKSFERGDVIVFRDPSDPKSFFVKRIVGLPLEKVDIQNGKVLTNGEILVEDYYNGDTLPDSSIILGHDQYFVLGDNRNSSFDSRNFGPISKSNINGKVFYKVADLIK